MHIAEIIAGAYYACVIIFALGSAGFAIATRERVYVLFTLHALAIGALTLTFPPIAPANALEQGHVASRIFAEGLVLGTAGLLLVHLVLPTTPRWLRAMVRAVAPLSLAGGLCGWWLSHNQQFLPLYGLLLVVLLSTVIVTLAVGCARGSSNARMLAIALAPLLGVGLTAAAIEMAALPSFEFYVEGMFAGFAFELVAVSVTLAIRLRTTMMERDAALIAASDARAESAVDPLTGLLNRRGFDAALADANGADATGADANGADATGEGFTALAILDCDHFKRINDNFGHATGDRVLRIIGDVLVLDGVIAARIGGEEFALLFTGHDWAETLEKLRGKIEYAVRRAIPELRAPVTLSAGAVSCSRAFDPVIAMLDADEALYRAKTEGRNRTCVAATAHGAMAEAA